MAVPQQSKFIDFSESKWIEIRKVFDLFIIIFLSIFW